MPHCTLSEVVQLSHFVKRTLIALHPGEDDAGRLSCFETLTQKPFTRDDMLARIADAKDSAMLSTALRVLRRDVMMSLIGRNATGQIDYFEVVRTMSDLAEVAVSAVVSVHARELAKKHGVPYGISGVPQDLMVVGMGKLGGRELNVSSDIDLIFLYDEDGETRATDVFPDARRLLSVHEFYERLARRIIPALNNVEGTGFVFRVDMRLRPNGESGPIVCSTDMLEEYLYTQGRDWERFAWLKSRIVNTPVFSSPAVFEQQCANVESLVRPFVFRKYLDFGAIASLTSLHEMIRAETARREATRNREGVNVKLGRGGIREIEFLTQTLQVIRGGREPKLRGKETLAMLKELAIEGALNEDVASQLSRDYVFLRDLEHAIQYVDDQQTQMLMNEGESLTRVAGLLGLSTDELWKRVNRVREFVAKAFDGVFQVQGDQTVSQDNWPIGWQTGSSSARAALAKTLEGLGYGADVEELVNRISALVSGRSAAARSEGARKRMQKLLQLVVEQCPVWSQKAESHLLCAQDVLARYLKLLEAIAGRSTYVALLYQYPRAAERVGRVLAASRWSADYLVAHPIILDELVDGRVHEMDNYTPVDWSCWLRNLQTALQEAQGDQERQMNLLRDAHHAAVFRLLIADLDGRFTVERLADQLSALADEVLNLVIEMAWSSLAKRHCEHPRFAVIGYGKLGGKELGYESDLDLVYLYDDDHPDADVNYSRLVRRMMSWLTVQTSSGILFDIDLRLRPNGGNGLVVSPMKMFSRYQRNEDGNGAWFWEHQALTRARFCAGDSDIGRRFEKERAYILQLPRTKREVIEQVLEMRAKMLEGHPNRSRFFDIKHDRGGMVDIEFIVQMVVLTYSHDHPELINNFGNILLLEMAADLNLIPIDLARPAVDAYRHYRQLQHEIRLNAGEAVPVRVPKDMVLKEFSAVKALWFSVFGTQAPQRIGESV